MLEQTHAYSNLCKIIEVYVISCCNQCGPYRVMLIQQRDRQCNSYWLYYSFADYDFSAGMIKHGTQQTAMKGNEYGAIQKQTYDKNVTRSK